MAEQFDPKSYECMRIRGTEPGPLGSNEHGFRDYRVLRPRERQPGEPLTQLHGLQRVQPGGADGTRSVDFRFENKSYWYITGLKGSETFVDRPNGLLVNPGDHPRGWRTVPESNDPNSEYQRALAHMHKLSSVCADTKVEIDTGRPLR
jgi:hypothetical protein